MQHRTPHHNHVSTPPGPSTARLFARPPVLMVAPRKDRAACPAHRIIFRLAAPPLAAGSTPLQLRLRAPRPARLPEALGVRFCSGGSLYPASPDACGGRRGAGRAGVADRGGAAGPRLAVARADPWRLAPPWPTRFQRAPRRWTRPFRRRRAARLPAAWRGVGSAPAARGRGAGRRPGGARRRHAGAVSAAPPRAGVAAAARRPRTKARTGRGRSAGTPVAFARPARGRPRSRSGPTSKGRRGAATAGPEDRGGGGERTGRTHPCQGEGSATGAEAFLGPGCW